MLDDVYVPLPGPVPPDAAAEFDRLLAELDAAAAETDPVTVDAQGPLDLTGRTTRPLWQLLVHAAATGRFALHGSGATDIGLFEPRQSNDVADFGNRRGVYAAADGLWPFYFAIVDRERVTSLINAAFTVVDRDSGAETGPWYFFSISATDPKPWRSGAVYLLPADGFERQPDRDDRQGRIRSAQLFCPAAVRPLGLVRVQPSEFPLLDAIRRHDPSVIAERAAADPDGFPWL